MCKSILLERAVDYIKELQSQLPDFRTAEVKKYLVKKYFKFGFELLECIICIVQVYILAISKRVHNIS